MIPSYKFEGKEMEINALVNINCSPTVSLISKSGLKEEML
jgi:hypothetical protein